MAYRWVLGTLLRAWARGRREADELRLRRALAAGLQLGENFLYSGVPHFGSEPYLISIGNNVSISSNVHFVTHDGAAYHLERIGLIEKTISFGRITVLDECGIGMGAIILPGVTIGPRSIVGAGAVVGRDVPPNSVVVGNPARFAMTVDALAEQFRREHPDYDPVAMKANKASELLRLYPRPW
jgi:acetyltransferase-like isoleucine patch superfamily enzyme